MSEVPRAQQFTGKLSREEAAAQREWDKARKRFNNDTAKYGYGTEAAKKAWKERIYKTRSV